MSKFFGCLLTALLIGLVLLVGPFVLMLAWNIFVPAVFGASAPQLTIFTAAAGYYLIGVLAGLLRSSRK